MPRLELDLGPTPLDHLLPDGFGRPFPKGAWVRQKFEGPEVEDIAGEVRRRLERPELWERVRPGARIALGVGSRGIGGLREIVQTTVEVLKGKGFQPFIVPAMGSHGGATAEGQRRLLAGYGISEETLGVPVEGSMEVVQVGTGSGGVPVFFSRPALEADGIIPICRIKPHTAFRGRYESGVLKMLVIGFGKHRGAATVHAQGFERFAEMIPELGGMLLEKTPVLFALATVENAFDRPALLEALTPREILEREPLLLEQARAWMGRILFDEFDLLVVDEIGKDISGDGMDPNVTGRFSQPFVTGGPRIQKIVVLDLTQETHGNANGIGGADVTTQKVVEQMDFTQTYTNALTSTVLSVVKLPLVMPTAESAIAVGLGTCNGVSPPEARVVRIKNTLELHRLWISEALLKEARGRTDLELLEEAPLWPSA